MARNDLYDRYFGSKALGGGSSAFSPSPGLSSLSDIRKSVLGDDDDEETSGSDRLRRETENYRTRLDDAGIDVDEELDDKRTWLGKKLNLEKDNNFLFDALDLFSRPLNGVMNAEAEKQRVVAESKQLLKLGQITEKEYYKRLNEYGLDDWGSDLWEGFSGKSKKTGSDVLEEMGVENKVGRAVGGFAMDVALDPLNATGGVIGKTALKGLGAAGKKIGDAIEATGDDGAALMKGARDTKNALGEAFNPNKYLPAGVKEYFQKIEATKNGLQEKSFKIVNNLVKNGGLEKGDDIARVMESQLNLDQNAGDMLEKINDLSSNGEIRLRGSGSRTKGVGRDLTELKNLINTATVNSPKTQNALKKSAATQQKHQTVIKEISDKYKGLNNLTSEISLVDDLLESTIGSDDFVKLSDLAGNHEKLKDLFFEGKDTLMQLKSILDPDEFKQVKEMLSDVVKVNKAKTVAQRSKAKQTDLMQPLQINKLDPNGADYRNLPTEARSTVVQLSQARKAANVEASAIQKEIDALEAQNVHLNNGAIDKAIKAKQDELKLVEDRMTQLEKGIDDTITQAGVERGYSINKNGKSAMAKAIMDDDGQIMESFLRNTGKLAPDESPTPEMLADAKVEIPRLARSLSNDEEVIAAADRMTEQYDELRNFASQNNIDIPNFDGYLTHVITDEYRKLTTKPPASDGRDKIGGDKKVVAERKHIGSVEDVNEVNGQELFQSNAYKAFVEGYKRVSNYVAAEGFVKHVLSNYAQKFDPADTAKYITDKGKFKLPEGKVLVKAQDFKFYNVLDTEGLKHLAVRPSDQFMVDKGTLQLMKRYDYLTSDEGASAFRKFFDGHMKVWKGLQLLSAGYHVRNAFGADFNRHVAGMSLPDISRYDAKAIKDLQVYDRKIIPKVTAGEKLTDKEQAIYDNVNDYLTSGLRDSSRYRNEFEEFDRGFQLFEEKLGKREKENVSGAEKVIGGAKKGFEAVTGASFKLGTKVDDVKRYGMYQWAKANPGKYTEQFPGSSNPAALKVKEAMFDYQDLTNFERQFMKRLMPFYTFSRNNIPFQFKHLIMNPMAYSNTAKLINASYEANDIDPQDIPPHLRNSMALGTGENQLAKTYLPLTDIGNFGDPMSALSQAVSMTTPVAKLPIELATNFDTFRQQEIQKFDGEKSDKYFGASPTVAHVLDQIGLRNPEKWAKTGAAAFSDARAGEMQGEESGLSKYMSSLFTDFDPEKVEQQKLWELRDELEGIKKKAEQNGVPIRTIAEIEKGSTSLNKYFGF
jgi:hypothetical protein